MILVLVDPAFGLWVPEVLAARSHPLAAFAKAWLGELGRAVEKAEKGPTLPEAQRYASHSDLTGMHSGF